MKDCVISKGRVIEVASMGHAKMVASITGKDVFFDTTEEMMVDHDIATISLNDSDPICGITTMLSSKASNKTVIKYVQSIYGYISDSMVDKLSETFTDMSFDKLRMDTDRGKNGKITLMIV